MTIDLAVLAVLFLAGGLGLVSGAIRQLAHLGGLVAGWLAARPLAQLAGPLAAKQLGYPLLVTTIACSFACFFVVYIASVFALRFVLGKVLPDGERGMLNRLGGFLLGAAKAAILVFVALSVLAFGEKWLVKLWPEFKKEAAPSLSMRLARQHGLFASLPAVGGLEKVLNASRDPQAAARLAEDPEFQALARDPRVKGMVDDQGIRRALQEGDVASLLSSVRVLEALNDPKMMDRLTRFESGEAAPAPVKPAKPDKPAERPPPGPSKADAAVLEGPRH
ncbi:MAG TPA: CvpA family protein [Myxococcales bacterium]